MTQNKIMGGRGICEGEVGGLDHERILKYVIEGAENNYLLKKHVGFKR